MKQSSGRAALAALALALLAAPGASAQVAVSQSYSSAPRPGPYIAYGPVCDRAALRDCQAEARFHMTRCDPFPGRFACADRILAEQSACMAATGCN
jgi:hypothetical protein